MADPVAASRQALAPRTPYRPCSHPACPLRAHAASCGLSGQTMAENALQMRPDDLVASQLAGGGKLSAPPKPLGEHNGGADQDADAWLLSAGHFRKLYKLAGAPHPRSQRLVGAPVSRRRITSARVGREHQRPACPRSSQQCAATNTTTLLFPPLPALFPYPPQCALAAAQALLTDMIFWIRPRPSADLRGAR